jgi:CopA family copper-resistance protein
MSNQTRRRFVQSVGLGAAAAALGVLRPVSGRAAAGVPTLSGSDFDLTLSHVRVNFQGKRRLATAVNGSVPGPTLHWREGTTVTLRVHNNLATPSSIHWHGIVLPFDMDGVPGISFSGIAPGATFTYRFQIRQSGTYWYHAHSRFQEQTGLYGAIVIEPAGGDPIRADRDHVMFLSDWTDEDPEHVFTTLKQRSDFYNFQLPTLVDFMSDSRSLGVREALAKRRMWNSLRMNPTDYGDVSGAAYMYLVNGATPSANWTGVALPGERVRVRLINGSSSTFFDVRIPGLSMTVVSADGQAVDPVTVEEIRLGAAETYDVIVEPTEDRAYTLFAQSMDRSGYARATLAPRLGMEAAVPALDPPTWLEMSDMSMDGMDMAGSRALDDPGPRLRGNGRRELTYADLHTIGGSMDPRPATREIQLRLTGNMQRFVWGFDGKKFSEAEPLHFDHGERLRIFLNNETMMAHPIHLHGMFGELEAENGEVLVRKHTFVVQPGKQLSYLVTADNPGQWAYHCHLIYHMMAGMFREVVVA